MNLPRKIYRLIQQSVSTMDVMHEHQKFQMKSVQQSTSNKSSCCLSGTARMDVKKNFFLFGKIAKILNFEFVFKKNGVSRDKCEEDELLEEIKEGKKKPNREGTKPRQKRGLKSSSACQLPSTVRDFNLPTVSLSFLLDSLFVKGTQQSRTRERKSERATEVKF